MLRNHVRFRPDVEGMPRIVCLDAGIAGTPAVSVVGPVDIQDPPLPGNDYVPPQAADHAIAQDGADRSALDITQQIASLQGIEGKSWPMFAWDPGQLFAKPIPTDVTVLTENPPMTIPTQVPATAQLPASSPAPVSIVTGPPMTCAFPVDAITLVLSDSTPPEQPQMDV